MESRQHFPHRERCGMLNLLHPSLPPRSFLSSFITVFLQSLPFPSLVQYSLAYLRGSFFLPYPLSSSFLSASLSLTLIPPFIFLSFFLCVLESSLNPSSHSLSSFLPLSQTLRRSFITNNTPPVIPFLLTFSNPPLHLFTSILT